MTVLEAVKEFEPFAEYLCENPKMMRDLLTDEEYRVRAEFRGRSLCFEVGYPSDDWNIHE